MSTSGRELLAYERNQPAVRRPEPTAPPEQATPPEQITSPEQTAPPEQTTPPVARRGRAWAAVVVLFAAVALVVGGVAIGVLKRDGAVDHQTRRALRAEQQLATLRERLARNKAKIDDQAQQLTRARRQLEQAQTPSTQPQLPAPDAATSFGDGLYQVGLAIQPGRYQTGGAADCYWAKLSTGDTNKVIVNNVAAGPQTVTIDSPYFESEACGTWTKVG